MTPKSRMRRSPVPKPRTVRQQQAAGDADEGDISVEVEPVVVETSAEDLERQFDELTQLLDGEPLSVEEAQRLLSRIHGTKDATELTADRAEALAQIQVAEATLESLATPAIAVPDPVPAKPGRRQAAATERMRKVARQAVTASVNLRQAEAALERLPRPDPELLAGVETAQGEVEEARDQMHPARRRTVGALISATGMVIVIATVGWSAWAYLVPSLLVLLVTADLRVAGAKAKAARAQLDNQLTGATAGDGSFDLAAGQRDLAAWQQATGRVEDATRRRDEAWAAWEKLAPGTDPEDVDRVVAPPEPAPTPAPGPVDPAAERARIMAETLIEDATRELAMIAEAEQELTLKLRAERSLAWHEAKAALGR